VLSDWLINHYGKDPSSDPYLIKNAPKCRYCVTFWVRPLQQLNLPKPNGCNLDRDGWLSCESEDGRSWLSSLELPDPNVDCEPQLRSELELLATKEYSERNTSSRSPASREKRFSIYVVELDRAVLNKKRFLAANPDHDPQLACFYVGMTGLTPDERFANHKKGHKACRYVQEYGLWLRRRIYEKYNPMKYDEAERMERELAEQLRAKGHAVWQQ
jgi:hypothetical protein